MRILHVSAQKPSGTGSGVYLTETMRAFAALGAQQAVVAGIAPQDEPAFPEGTLFVPVVFETEALPFPVVGMSNEMPYRATRYRDMTPEMVSQVYAAFDAAIDEVLRQFTPDLVICHHLYLVTAHLAMRDWPCPVTGISHSTDLRQFRTIALERDAVRAGIRRLDRIFALHHAQAREIVDAFGVDEDKVRVVGTGYNDSEFRLLPGIERPGHSLVFVGKIWEQKGVPYLLHAVDLLPERFDDLRLELVGGHSTPEEYHAIVGQACGTRHRVHFRGKVSQDDLVLIYNASEVFVLPSLYEGLPLVMVEAMACGCKVVVTDLPGIREWIDASLEDAPVVYVTPPGTDGEGKMLEGEQARFERDLACALERAFDMPAPALDVGHLSWKGVSSRMLEAVR